MKDTIEPVANKDRTVRMDITIAQTTELSLGDSVSVVIKGTVGSLNEPYTYTSAKGKKKAEPFGSMSVNVTSMQIEETENNEFTKIAKEEE